MEAAELGDLGYKALVVMGFYLVVMLGLGWLGRKRRKEESLRDFYLAGSSFGFFVLFLTLFATQYSGNTLLGFAGRSYNRGGVYIVSITFMILVITVFMIYAPRLFRLSRKFGYITPADYVFHRFGSHPIRILTVILLAWGLSNYILEQLVAMGHGVEALSGGKITSMIVATMERLGMGAMVAGTEPGQFDFMGGVLLLALVMVVYESLGGMRAVAWTDVVQGLILFFGCGCILFILVTSEGGLPAAAEIIQEVQPAKLEVPGVAGLRTWISNLILLGLGVAIYPHAIQRIFAARSLPALRKSMGAMAFMPFVTTLLAFLIGYIGISRFPGLAGADGDKITIYVLSSLTQSVFTFWLVVIVLTAIVAAIMSTADSALLSIGSMFTKDIYKVYIKPDASPRHYLKVGKWFGWMLMIVLILGAYVSLKTESSIWLLILLKLEFMVQLSPIFVLGVFWRRLPAWAVFAGLVSGTLITLVIWCGVVVDLWSNRSPWGISAGVWGLGVNYGICVLGGLLAPASVPIGPSGLAAQPEK